jgi:hypothetical protein
MESALLPALARKPAEATAVSNGMSSGEEPQSAPASLAAAAPLARQATEKIARDSLQARFTLFS